MHDRQPRQAAPRQDRSSRSRSRTSSPTIHVPETYLGGVLKLCEEKRGRQKEPCAISALTRVVVEYELPLNEVVLDFHDRLKSVSKGYASLDYEFIELRPGDLVKLDVRVNGEPVDALSLIVHRDRAYQRGREVDRDDEGADPAADVRGRPAGRDRRQDHRPRDREGAAQERHRQVLRRRHHAQAQAAREAEGRQEADEAGRAAWRFPRRPSSPCSRCPPDALAGTPRRAVWRSRSRWSCAASCWRPSRSRRLDAADAADRRLSADRQAALRHAAAGSRRWLAALRPAAAGRRRSSSATRKDPPINYVKRVIAVAGEVVEIRDKQVLVERRTARRAGGLFRPARARAAR